MRQFNFQDAKAGAAITVKVTPRAKKTEVIGFMEDGTIRMRVAAAPEAGAANEALVEFLSEKLGIPKNQIDIMGGLSSERKLISLIGISPAQVDTVMQGLAAETAKAKAKAKIKPKASGKDQKMKKPMVRKKK